MALRTVSSHGSRDDCGERAFRSGGPNEELDEERWLNAGLCEAPLQGREQPVDIELGDGAAIESKMGLAHGSFHALGGCMKSQS
jgi:hypothetical protein